MELMIDFYHLLNVLFNTSTTEQLVKEITCPENVVVEIQHPVVPGVVEIGEIGEIDIQIQQEWNNVLSADNRCLYIVNIM